MIQEYLIQSRGELPFSRIVSSEKQYLSSHKIDSNIAKTSFHPYILFSPRE